MKAIDVQQLEKTYSNGVHALKGVDLTIQDGDFFGLLGANGAGKTTMISILTGTATKTGGSAKIFGIDIDKDHNKAKEMIGLVPQEFNFNIFEKVIDIVVTQGGYFGIPRKECLKRAQKILEALDLWEKRDHPSMQLSGGMKRRLMIARALIHQPKLLILDEPTAGVDVELRHGMWKYLQELNKSGVTILLTSHYLEEIEALCRNVAMIKKGEIVINGTVKEVLQSLDRQIYVVNVDKVKDIDELNTFKWKKIDDTTLEVEVDQKKTVNELVKILDTHKMLVQDIKPKSNRLEQLFLNLLNE
ncbi:MAG: ABC transporter ATP-binding protein [Candidatus Gracilibacteria bacterium]|nr:ABC transporter ATP-binding protein [Candidatus Peregrinibacteria bacterium]